MRIVRLLMLLAVFMGLMPSLMAAEVPQKCDSCLIRLDHLDKPVKWDAPAHGGQARNANPAPNAPALVG